MATRKLRPPRRPRIRTAAIAGAILTTGALAVPSPVAAYTEDYCIGTGLASGADCIAPERHNLVKVEGHVFSGPGERICVASYQTSSGPVNSTWVCDYGGVVKYLSVAGHGAVHNGSPYSMTVWFGRQTF